jgi:two-component system response regulator FixJ
MSALIHVVDDDEGIRRSLSLLLRASGFAVDTHASGTAFLAGARRSDNACLLSDVRMPDMDGLALQNLVAERYPALPVVIMTGHGDVPMAVRAMHLGAVDFLEKPFAEDALLAALARALEQGRERAASQAEHRAAREIAARLTPREREILALLAAGATNKEMARQLDISPRTAEVHRMHLMEKARARTLADLVRLSLLLG